MATVATYRKAARAYSQAWERHHAAIVAQHHGNHSAHAVAYLQRQLAPLQRQFDKVRRNT